MEKDFFDISVFGDSHSVFFFQPNLLTHRLPKPATPIRVAGKRVGGASVAGFRPHASTLKTKELIRQNLHDSDGIVLAFGQVDLEIGYYYRKIIKQEPINPKTYIPWLVDIYKNFVKSLPLDHRKLALKGVNPTTFESSEFVAHDIAPMITPKNEKQWRYRQKIRDICLSEDEQNETHLSFNQMVKEFAAEMGLLYFDIFSQTTENGRVKDIFRPAVVDHHLADIILLRRVHHQALVETFLKPAGWTS